MNNKLSDLNNYLFAQLERLDDEKLSSEELELELRRSKSISIVANQIIENASVQLEAAKLVAEFGPNRRFNLNGLIECSDE